MKLINESWQVLQEADGPFTVTLRDEERIDPKSFSIKDMVKGRKAEIDEKERQEAEAKRKEELKVKYADVLSKVVEGKDATDKLTILFDALVPQNGKADTVAGEIVRAMMRIMYRDWNDGDKFYEGYGFETCAPSASYLMSIDDLNVFDDFLEIAEDAGQYEPEYEYDEEYTNALSSIADKVIDYIINNPETLETENEKDSRSFDVLEVLEESQPRYEYWLEIPWEVQEYINADKISVRDVAAEVEEWLNWDSTFNGCEVYTNYGDSITVDELTRDGYETLKDWDNHSLWEDYIDELKTQYGDPDERGRDESLKEKKEGEKKINKGTVGYILKQNKDLIDSIGGMSKDKAIQTLKDLFEKNKEDLQQSYADEVIRNAARKKSAADILIYLYNILLAQQDLKVLDK